MGYETRSRNKSSISLFTKIIYGMFVLSLGWIFLSILADRNPLQTLSSVKNTLTGNTSADLSRSELQKIVETQQSRIDSFSQVLDELNARKEYDNGMIDVGSEYLNMRDQPSLSSNILLKIPDSSIVDILYYDTNTFVLDGKSGTWCRIKYADEEGWIWGNYVRPLD